MASVAWQFTPNLNTYFRYAEGFKSGGFNGEFSDPTLSSADNITETQTPFKPEKQRSFELGTKSMWLAQRVVLNAAVYYNKAMGLKESNFLCYGSAACRWRNAASATNHGAEHERQRESRSR